MQKIVKEFNEYVKIKAHRKQMPVSARMLDIESEVGELSKEVLKNTSYGTKDFVVTEDFKLELGDVLYSVLSMAEEVGVDSKNCLEMVIKKYKARVDGTGNMGSEG